MKVCITVVELLHTFRQCEIQYSFGREAKASKNGDNQLPKLHVQ